MKTSATNERTITSSSSSLNNEREVMFLRKLPQFVQRCQSIRFLSQPTPKIIEMVQTPSIPHDMAAAIKYSVMKRVPKKKRLSSVDDRSPEKHFQVSALATADWYDLEKFKEHFLSSTTSFQLVPISDLIDDVICVQTKGQSRSHAFIFDDGAVVFWNFPVDDEKQLLEKIDEISDNRYPNELVNSEKERMNFTEGHTNSYLANDLIRLSSQSLNEQLLDKYTISNALALSVKLGIWEALLDDEVEFVADLANRLKRGQHIKIAHGLMQRKSGELYSLKHAVNLSHDFLDTPDFYWSHSRLESLYKRVFNYFTIAKRTRVLNERLNFSLELISVIEASLNEKKHVRLEWIIIILICCEVFFNIIDHLEFFTLKTKDENKPIV